MLCLAVGSGIYSAMDMTRTDILFKSAGSIQPSIIHSVPMMTSLKPTDGLIKRFFVDIMRSHEEAGSGRRLKSLGLVTAYFSDC